MRETNLNLKKTVKNLLNNKIAQDKQNPASKYKNKVNDQQKLLHFYGLVNCNEQLNRIN